MKKIGTKNRIFFFLLLALSIFFIFRVSWTIHTQEKLVEKEISKHIDTIEQKLKYYFLHQKGFLSIFYCIIFYIFYIYNR